MEKVLQAINSAQRIVIVQADNPDGDSLASSLALEHILSDAGKDVALYCGVDVPTYLRYMNGWDRIAQNLPKNFDASIILDTTALSLLESLVKSGEINWLKTKPCIIIDHHSTEPTIDFASAMIHNEAVSTGELIHGLCQKANWAINAPAAGFLAASILSDSLGLTSEAVTSDSVRVLADLIDRGANLALIDEQRRSTQKKAPEIIAYKGRLLERIEYTADSRIAYVHIPWEEIEKYSHAYNPSMLVLDEMRMAENVRLAIAFKTYPDGKITAKIRTNYGTRIAGKLAEHFGGGGHPYAAGFKITDGRTLQDIQADCLAKASELLDTLDGEYHD